jgi:hypothetical protein
MSRTWVNNGISTLTANISDTATTVTVDNGAVFGSPSVANEMTAVIRQGATRELVHITNVSGNTLTLVRAREGTTGQAFTAGATIANVVTAAFTSEVETLLAAGGNSFAAGLRNASAGVYAPLLTLEACTGLANATRTLNQLELYPIMVAETLGIDRLGAWLSTVDNTNASAVHRFGIWNHDAANERPSTLVVDGGTVTTFGGVARWIEVTAVATLTPGIYWIGNVAQGSANVSQTSGFAANQVVHKVPIRRTVAPFQNQFPGLASVRYTGISGALADITTAPASQGGDAVIVWARHS